MKKIILFLPIVLLLFLFQPTFNAHAVIICPFGPGTGCDTDPGGGDDANTIYLGGYNSHYI